MTRHRERLAEFRRRYDDTQDKEIRKLLMLHIGFELRACGSVREDQRKGGTA